MLADYFADCGKVTSVRMARGGLGPVRAWLEFESPDSIFSAKEHDGTVRNHLCSSPPPPPPGIFPSMWYWLQRQEPELFCCRQRDKSESGR